MMILF